MQSFQGSGFTIELPDDVIDSSSYCFSFPSVGEYAPNLTIVFARPAGAVDLADYVKEQRKMLASSVQDLELVNEISNKRGLWSYVVSIVEWGPSESRIRQKHTYISVPGERPRLITMTGTDLAVNFKQSEPIFNQAIKSFTPNDIQFF